MTKTLYIVRSPQIAALLSHHLNFAKSALIAHPGDTIYHPPHGFDAVCVMTALSESEQSWFDTEVVPFMRPGAKIYA